MPKFNIGDKVWLDRGLTSELQGTIAGMAMIVRHVSTTNPNEQSLDNAYVVELSRGGYMMHDSGFVKGYISLLIVAPEIISKRE